MHQIFYFALFLPKCGYTIGNKPPLVQMTAGQRTRDKPLLEPRMTQFIYSISMKDCSNSSALDCSNSSTLDCSNSSTLAMELLQSSIKPLTFTSPALNNIVIRSFHAILSMSVKCDLEIAKIRLEKWKPFLQTELDTSFSGKTLAFLFKFH